MVKKNIINYMKKKKKVAKKKVIKKLSRRDRLTVY